MPQRADSEQRTLPALGATLPAAGAAAGGMGAGRHGDLGRSDSSSSSTSTDAGVKEKQKRKKVLGVLGKKSDGESDDDR